MILPRICLLIGILTCTLASAEEWKRWPARADEFSTTIAVPPRFQHIDWRPPSRGVPKGGAPLLLAARFRSEDGKAEFAVMVYYVRALSAEPEARRMTLPLARGEKVTHQKTNRRKINGEQGTYWLYDEESTVEGTGLTRYRLNSFSTSSLPGASSVLWELQVTDESARKRYAPLWRKFKESLEVEED